MFTPIETIKYIDNGDNPNTITWKLEPPFDFAEEIINNN